MQIRAVTFDLWNTLLCDSDFSNLRIALLESILREQGFPREKDLVRSEYVSAAKRIDLAWRNEQRNLSLVELIELMLKNLDVRLRDESRREVLRGFEEAIYRDVPPLVDGVEQMLRKLHGRYRIGLISDTGMTPGWVIRRVLDNYGLLQHFHCTVFSDEVGFPKPHPEMFRRAIDGLNEQPDEIVHVGDLLRTDIVGAKSIGMKTVWFNRKNKPREAVNVAPDYEIGDLSELLPLLEKAA